MLCQSSDKEECYTHVSLAVLQHRLIHILVMTFTQFMYHYIELSGRSTNSFSMLSVNDILFFVICGLSAELYVYFIPDGCGGPAFYCDL